MDSLSLPIKLLIAIFLGAVIGLEREASHKGKVSTISEKPGVFGGVRTFSLISLLGAVGGVLSLNGSTNLFLTLSVAFFALVISYYIASSLLTKTTGLTTELASIFTFLIGFFTTSEVLSIQIAISLTVVISLILSLKERTRTFAYGITKSELNAFLGFAIVALVVLPFLPKQSYYLTDIPAVKTMLTAYHVETTFLEQLEIVNPFKLWFIVALITGIDVFGYTLKKLAGKQKGLLLTCAIGGFISSTSTTQSLAQQSKRGQNINELVAAAIISNMTSFLQIFILVAPLNGSWLVAITPTLFLIIISAVISSFFFIRKQKKHDTTTEVEPKEQDKEIFELGPAIKFAIVLVTIRAVTKTALAFFGQAGFTFTSVIASFTGLDAIVINLAELSGGPITFTAGLLTLIIVNATNLLSKVAYSFFQGNRKFALKFFISMLIVIASSFVGYAFTAI